MHGPDRLRRRVLFVHAGLDQGQCERRRFRLPQGLGTERARTCHSRATWKALEAEHEAGRIYRSAYHFLRFADDVDKQANVFLTAGWRHQQRETPNGRSPVSRHGADSRGPNPARKSVGQGLPAESSRNRRQWPALVRHGGTRFQPRRSSRWRKTWITAVEQATGLPVTIYTTQSWWSEAGRHRRQGDSVPSRSARSGSRAIRTTIPRAWSRLRPRRGKEAARSGESLRCPAQHPIRSRPTPTLGISGSRTQASRITDTFPVQHASTVETPT